MALGKLAIVIGAGIVGSIITKDGVSSGLSGVADVFSGTLKIFTRSLQQEKESSQSTSKPQTDSLLAQVNNLRQELQFLASSRPVTIVTGSSSGSGTQKITAIIVVGAVGFLYIRWKGWKISDMMFVTKRGLADASAKVGKQLDQVQSSISAVKRFLSSRIDRVDCRLEECKEIAESTRDEVQVLHGDISAFQEEMQSVHLVVQNLETKLGRLEMSQDLTTRGIYDLCQFANRLEHQSRNSEILQLSPAGSSSHPAIESPSPLPITRTGSLPPSPSASPSTGVGTPKVLLSSKTISASGFRELQGVLGSTSVRTAVTEPTNGSATSAELSNGSATPAELSNGSATSAELSNGSSTSAGSNRFGLKLPSFGFGRTRAPAS